MRASLPSLLLLALPLQDPAHPPAAGGAQDAVPHGSPPERTLVPKEGVVVQADFGTGWPSIEVEVEGKGPYRMILDTGAGGLVLDADLAAELDLEVIGTARLGDPSSPEANEADLVRVRSLQIGGATFEGLHGVAWERPPALRRPGSRGIVGLPVFSGCLLTLDRGAGEVRLARGTLPEPDGRTVLAIEKDPYGLVSLPIEVAGERLLAHLDSGNSRSVILPARLEASCPLVAGTKRTGRGMRASGPVEFTVARLDGVIRIGAIELEHPEVRFDPSLPVANLGAEFLDACVPTIDQASGRVRLVPRARVEGDAPKGEHSGGGAGG